MSKKAEYADRVRVPSDALTFNDSAPPNKFRNTALRYADPSAEPASVPVLIVYLPRSCAAMKTERSVTVLEGSVASGWSMYVDIGDLKIP